MSDSSPGLSPSSGLWSLDSSPVLDGATANPAPWMEREEAGVGQAEDTQDALLDGLILRFLVDIQVEMSGRQLACLDLRERWGWRYKW